MCEKMTPFFLTCRGHAAEEAVVDDADRILKLHRHLRRVLDRLREVKVYDVVAIVSDGDLVPVRFVGRARSHAQDRVAPGAGRKGGDGAKGVLVAEGSDLDREGETRSESVAELRFVHCRRGLRVGGWEAALCEKSERECKE